MQNSSDDETLAPGNNYPVVTEKTEKAPVLAPNGMERSLDLNNLAQGKKALGASTGADGIPTYIGLSGNKLGLTITVVASLCFSLFGYDQGVMSGIINSAQFFETFPACDPAVQGASRSSLFQATYTALYEIGCMVGAIGALLFGDRLGRKRMIMGGAVVVIIGVIIQITTFAGHWAGGQFIIGRIITGVGNGFLTSTVPTWHSELSKSHNRGLMVCIEASTISTGTAVAYWIDYGLHFVEGSAAWRVPIALQVVFAIIILVSVPFMPESPRWLISRGWMAEAHQVCGALEPGPIDHPAVTSQTRVIKESLEGQTRLYKRHMLTSGHSQHFRRVLIGVSSQIFQQIGGCNAVIYFAPVIYETYLGLSTNLSLILGGVNVTVYALAATGSFFMIERVGRRKMFLIGSAGQAIAMFITMAGVAKGTHEALKASVFGLFLYLVFFGATWLELPWLYPAEINPLATRTNANAISTINNWLWNFAVVEATPPMLTGIGWGTFCLFGCINVCFIPVIWFFYPETSGRSLEEVDLIFARGYLNKESYVKAAKEMPPMNHQQIDDEWRRLGLADRGGQGPYVHGKEVLSNNA